VNRRLVARTAFAAEEEIGGEADDSGNDDVNRVHVVSSPGKHRELTQLSG
jgi:hypothetical protein